LRLSQTSTWITKIPACVARALHSTVRADGTHMLYARSFITCDNTHFRTIFFSQEIGR
jgi:hypothetical protein